MTRELKPAAAREGLLPMLAALGALVAICGVLVAGGVAHGATVPEALSTVIFPPALMIAVAVGVLRRSGRPWPWAATLWAGGSLLLAPAFGWVGLGAALLIGLGLWWGARRAMLA